MLHQSIIIIITKAIKLFGIGSVFQDIYLSFFDAIGVNWQLLMYTISIEALFILLKNTKFAVPVWVQFIEDVI